MSRAAIFSRGESFRKPNTNIQYTISPRNPIQYNIQYFPIFILGQYKYWFLGPNSWPNIQYFFEKNFNHKIGSNQVIFDHPFIFLQILFFLSQNTVNKIL